jgi:hypothetical protein
MYMTLGPAIGVITVLIVVGLLCRGYYQGYKESNLRIRQKSIMQQLKKTFQGLNQLNVPFVLTFGTLLGYVREKGVILGDYDGDIIVGIEWEPLLVRNLDVFHQAGLETTVWDNQLITLYTPGKEDVSHVDIYFVHQTGGESYINIVTNWCIPYKDEWFMREEVVEYFGEQVGLPHDMDGFLTYQYGENYMVPQNSKGRLCDKPRPTSTASSPPS